MLAAFLLAAVVTNAAPVAPVASTNMPHGMVSVWKQAERERVRTADLLARGAIDAAEAARRRAAIPRAFARVCRAKGIPAEQIAHWEKRLPNLK